MLGASCLGFRLQVSGFRLEGSWLGTYEAIPVAELLHHLV